jgi:hypothetical protein
MHELRVGIMAVAAGMAFATTVAAGGPKLKPGKWEITRTVTNSKAAQPYTTTQTNCISEADAADPVKVMTTGGNCVVKDRSEKGDSVKWTMECRGEKGAAAMESTGEIKASGNRAEGGTEMKYAMGGDSVVIKTTWKGKRVGDCD